MAYPHCIVQKLDKDVWCVGCTNLMTNDVNAELRRRYGTNPVPPGARQGIEAVIYQVHFKS